MAEATLEEIGAILILRNQEQFIAGIRSAIAEEAKLEVATKKAGAAAKLSGGSFGFLSKGLSAALHVAKDLAIGVAAVGVAVGVIGVKRLMDLQKAQAQTAAVIQSTGGKAGVTAKQVDALAYSVQQYSGLDRTVVSSGANMLLMFSKIQNSAGKNNDIFNQSVALASDLSIRMGRNVPQAALQLGKALQDPITGLLMLRRAGVIFTKQEQAQIKSMQQHGDLLGAQRAILARLRQEVGGAAAAYGKTVPGLLERAKQDMKDLSAKIVEPLLRLAVPVLEKVVGMLTKFGPQLGNIGNKISGIVSKTFEIIPRAMKMVGAGDVRGAAGLIDQLFGGKGNTTKIVEEIIRSIQRVVVIIQSLIPIAKDAATAIAVGLAGAVVVIDRLIQFWSQHTVGVRRALVVLATAFVAIKASIGIWNAGLTVMKAWRAILPILTGETSALDAAMEANPVGLIVLGVAALVVGFGALYVKVQVFRNLVNNVVSFFQHDWMKLLLYLLLPFTLGGILVWTFRDKIMDMAHSAIDWFKQHWPMISAVLTGPFAGAVLVISRNFEKIRDVFKGVINWVIDRWNGLQFKLPTIHIIGTNRDIGGGTIGVPKINRLHQGGMTTSPGMVNIRPGEEIVSMPKGATVVPLSHPSVDLSGLNVGGDGDQVIQLVVDGKVLAETVYSKMRDRQARR